MLSDSEQHLDLAREQPPRRAGQRPRRADDRCVRAMSGAERVVDVEVLPFDEVLHEGGIARFLPRVEPQVLEQLDAGGELREPSADGRHRPPLVGLPLRPAEMAACGDRGAVTSEPLDGRQRGSDAQIVGDLAVFERHVEVGAQQHAPPGDVGQIFEKGELHRMARGSTGSRRVTGSRRR